MKKCMAITCCAAAMILCSLAPAGAKTLQQTTISSSQFFLDGVGYTLFGPGNLVDAGDYVLIELPGATMTGQSDPSRNQFVTFSLSIPKGHPGQLLSGER
ncbi:MAG: hypothetical protein ACOZEN_09930 [Thermodesulfobacteriota bacterium]